MSRKFSFLVVLCILLFGAILAGYWDMLDSEKLRAVRDQATASMAEMTGQARSPTSTAPPSAASPAPSAAAPSPDPTGPAPSATDGAAGQQASIADPAGPAATSAEPGDAASPADAPSDIAVVPRFDILRVEPDGSAVLAGRASPNSDIRLMDGDRLVGTARATAEGDFAIVLDERLAAGNHQIRIEAQPQSGARVISAETAIVSVPKPGEPGNLLAMVEAPNKPSRLITLPEGEGTGTAAPAGQDSAPAAGTAPVEPRDVASLQPEPPPLPQSAAPLPFAVEAVEIENGSIYIAGRAPGKEPVRAYVDDRLVGEDRTRANGRFLVTAKIPLDTGNHRIRVDMIGGDGAVASRVEVPFAKPEGGSMSAIASNETAPADGEATAEASPAVAPSRVAPSGPTDGTAPSPAGKDVAEAAEASAGDAAVATVMQPALEGVKARVLIRRGDTLWRISRQTYGQGRRYTVIYLANGDQIRNPNRIYPGQVFRLPKGEEAPSPAVQ